jgi:uncharacterized protein
VPVIRIPKGTAHAVTLQAGQRLRIIDVEGTQVADFIAFNADDLTESLSTVHTLVSIGRLFPTTGDKLRTNRRRPMAEITRDDTGRHDMLIAMCDPWRYEYDFGVKDHRSCSDNYLEGTVQFGQSLAKPGDVVELLALLPLIAAVSACPMDLNPISGFATRDVAIEIA